MKFNKLIEMVNTISIIDIVELRITLKRSGRNYLGICPFHNDTNLGSFVVTPDKNLWKCFSCGSGYAGDGIKFISLYDNLSYFEAVIKIATEFGIIKSKADLQSEDWENKPIPAPKKTIVSIGKKTSLNRIDLHKIYSIFMEELKLNENDKTELLNRGLTEKDIKRGRYFTFPSPKHAQKIITKFEEQGYQSAIKDVPGFYFNEETNEFLFTNICGIGIPICDAYGHITGFQVRKRRKNIKNRYVWFSSSFADGTNGTKFGTSAKPEIDVIYPSKVRTKNVFITEGHFKAVQLAKNTGAIALSVQGITNWSKISSALKGVEKRCNFKVAHTFLAFDADCFSNATVMDQLIKISDHLKKEGYLSKYLFWDITLGKGIDDLIVAHGLKNNVSVVSKSVWDTKYQKAISFIKTAFPDVKKAPKNIYNSIMWNQFQQLIEETKQKKEA